MTMTPRAAARHRCGTINPVFSSGVRRATSAALPMIKKMTYIYSPIDILSNIYLSIPNSKVTFLGNLCKEQMLGDIGW